MQIAIAVLTFWVCSFVFFTCFPRAFPYSNNQVNHNRLYLLVLFSQYGLLATSDYSNHSEKQKK